MISLHERICAAAELVGRAADRRKTFADMPLRAGTIGATIVRRDRRRKSSYIEFCWNSPTGLGGRDRALVGHRHAVTRGRIQR